MFFSCTGFALKELFKLKSSRPSFKSLTTNVMKKKWKTQAHFSALTISQVCRKTIHNWLTDFSKSSQGDKSFEASDTNWWPRNDFWKKKYIFQLPILKNWRFEICSGDRFEEQKKFGATVTKKWGRHKLLILANHPNFFAQNL